MNMTTWAEKEIELACAREKASSTEECEWDYGCACYESALKAFKSLMEDGHSGYSICVTKSILWRLIDGKPLTPIEDTPDIWGIPDVSGHRGEVANYQCTRMSSLFKYVYADGTVAYTDVNRVRCEDFHNPSNSWYNGNAARIIDEMFPITMPYMPTSKQYVVRVEEFLTDPKNGDFDTVGYLEVRTPDGDIVPISLFFKDAEHGTGVEEISLEEYVERKKLAESLQSKPDCDDYDHDISGLTEEE